MYVIENELNYAAEVVTVERLIDLPGLDNLKGLPVGGFTALVPKTTEVGDTLVVFPAESQLSEDFCFKNNLYAQSDLNQDPGAKGYLGKNRRVRAIRLRGNLSSALAMSVDVLREYHPAGETPAPGTVFDTINGVTISRKYVTPTKESAPSVSGSKVKKAWKRVDAKFLPEHLDTEAYWRSESKLRPDDFVTLTQKLHGTSVRIGNVPTKIKPTWRSRLAQKLGVKVAELEPAVVGGSRKVIKDPENLRQNHFYSSDIWTEAAELYGPLLPENVILYGELIGWAGVDQPIQRGYTYDLPNGERELYVYRVVVVASDGGTYDLSWEGVKEFCVERGLSFVPELGAGQAHSLNVDDWLDEVYSDIFPQAVPLSDKGTVDEGICIRREGVVPFILKAKSPKFFEHETRVLDSGEEIAS